MSKKLLLADDSVVIQKLVGLSFANEDVEIFSTDNGDDALIQAREIQPDVVLADVVMPGLSGYEVCEAIKQDPALAHTPVLLLAGTFETFDEARAASVGADGQITKPFEAQALVERVNAVMNAKPVIPESIVEPVVEPVIPATAFTPPSTLTSTPAALESADTPLGTEPEQSILSPLPPSSPPSPFSSASDDTDDLFEKNVSSLSSGENTPLLDATPNLSAAEASPAFPAGDDPNESTASGLFGAPGEGASEELDTQGGNMVLGQMTGHATTPPQASGFDASSGSDLQADDDATIAMMPEMSPPMPPATPPATPQSMPPSEPIPPATERFAADGLGATQGDPLANLNDEFGLDDPLSDPLMVPPAFPIARPVDLDAVFDGASSEADATILMPMEDPNATTSPNLDEPVPAPTSFDDLTVHVPSADIDHDTAAAPSPDAFGSEASSPQETIVADLDASLEATAQPVAPASSFDPNQAAAATAVPQTTDDPGDTIIQMPEDPDPLDFGPSSVTADDLDFAFDVSEQVAAENSVDPLEESFSSLMDISESQILAGTPEQPSPAAETIVAGYDVSSSDLATADTTYSQSNPQSDAPIPEPEELHELPELPQSHEPLAPPAPPEPSMGTAGIFDELTTGSALDEIARQSDFVGTSDLDASRDLLDQDFRDDAYGNDLYSPADADLDHPMAESAGVSAAPSGADTDYSTDITEDSTEDRAEHSTDDHAADPLARDGADEFAIGSGASDSGAIEDDRRVPHLSPVMEQRIQETLEKVAWEAFSDLSESIVKQVMNRVEQIAWEVIPEMAETLVREEIRKMKGEDD
jgi:CheY-like chemotaxis protein